MLGFVFDFVRHLYFLFFNIVVYMISIVRNYFVCLFLFVCLGVVSLSTVLVGLAVRGASLSVRMVNAILDSPGMSRVLSRWQTLFYLYIL